MAATGSVIAVTTRPDTLVALGRLLRFTVRRDLSRLSIWTIAFVGIMVASALSIVELYPDQFTIESYASIFRGNPALVVFAGPGYGFDTPTTGVILVNETQLWGAIAFALMAIFLVARGIRGEEDAERTELIRSHIVGRHAPQAATLMVVAAAMILIALLSTIATIMIGYGVVGSIALISSMATVGLFFIGVTAVVGQVMGSSRATIGVCAGLLVLAFIVRAIGDISGSGVSWLSPIGIAQGVRAYAEERWWTLGVLIAGSMALVLASFWLSTHRDLGSGMLPERRGRERFNSRIRGGLGLAVRLQRGPWIAWVILLSTTGLVFGSIGDDIDRMLLDNPQLADFFAQIEGGSLTDSYFATAVTMLALVACGFGISALLMLRNEEMSGRIDLLLTGSMGRVPWVLGAIGISLVGTCLVVLMAGASIGFAYALVLQEPRQIAEVALASAYTLPAVVVIIGVTTLLFGIRQRFALMAWGLLAAVAIIVYLGEVLRLPNWIRGLSPFHHVPATSVREADLRSLTALVIIGVLAAGVGVTLFRRRDLGRT